MGGKDESGVILGSFLIVTLPKPHTSVIFMVEPASPPHLVNPAIMSVSVLSSAAYLNLTAITRRGNAHV